MARITIQDILTDFGVENMYDLVQSIASDTPSFQQYSALTNADNITDFGIGLQQNQTLQNDFINTLVDRIGKVYVQRKIMHNPLKIFKKGSMPWGRKIEDVFTDLAQEKKYSMKGSENTVFQRTLPNVHVLFHERNRESQYRQTISRQNLVSAFTDETTFGNFFAAIINAMYNSAEVDEYKYTKLVAENYHAKGFYTYNKVTQPTDQTTATSFVQQLISTAMEMSLPMGTRNFNSLAVHTRTDINNLYILIPAKTLALINTQVLARAFNLQYTDFMGHVVPIDNFAYDGSDGKPRIEAIMVDEDFFMIYDNLFSMETIYNPQGLYWNHYLNVWQTLSASRFANAVAFVSGADVPAVTSVIINPAILSLSPQEVYEFTAVVRATDNTAHTLTWEVAAANGSTLSGTTIIDQTGKLTVGTDQTGDIKVTAKTNIGTTESPIYVTGESIVSID